MNVSPAGKREKTAIVIGGGVGPLAGTLLHQSIILETTHARSDAEHFDVVHLSLSTTMPDRTNFLLGRDPCNPGRMMGDDVAAFGAVLASSGRSWIVAIPCCTFYAPPILDAFLARLASVPGMERVIHLIDDTVEFIRTHPATPGKVGVLSTEGAYLANVWQQPLRQAGLDVVNMSPEEVRNVHAAIYHPDFGLKAAFPPTQEARDRVTAVCSRMVKAGAEALVLGCTELSALREPIAYKFGDSAVICDPIAIQATACVTAALGAKSGRELALDAGI